MDQNENQPTAEKGGTTGVSSSKMLRKLLAAQKVLIKWKGPELVPVLEPVLKSERSDARLRAVDLLTGISDPRVLELLLDRIDDRTAKVAARAVDGVAVSTDPRTQFELLAMAFGERLENAAPVSTLPPVPKLMSSAPAEE